LTGILGQINGYLPQTGLTGTQSNALNTIEHNNATASAYSPAIQNYTTNMLNGGGALNQAGAVNQNYLNYQKATQPLASNTDYNPYNTPGFKDAINTAISDITNSTNGQFAAAGRDFSGMNSQALGRGIMQGIAPTIASQYNQNVQNQQNAASNLYGAGNTTSGLQTGLQTLANTNAGTGVSSVGAGLDAMNQGAKSTLAAEAEKLGIPLQNLGMLANIGVPIAGLGSSSSGTSTTNNQMSGADQFAKIMSGIGGTNGQGGGTGLLGLLSFL
jgi:hypothetical protein